MDVKRIHIEVAKVVLRAYSIARWRWFKEHEGIPENSFPRVAGIASFVMDSEYIEFEVKADEGT